MDDDGERRSSQEVQAATLYRLDSNQSSSSIFENVEMAHDELFSGPIAESLPTSVSAFAHRRPRADSVASFTYYDDEAFEPSDDEDYDRRSSLAADSVNDNLVGAVDEDQDSADLVARRSSDDYILQRRASTQSAVSGRARLLRRDSTATIGSGRGIARTQQKIYLLTEDLTIAIAGFRTSGTGNLLFWLLCLATGGIAYLLLRWVPRWHVKLTGRPWPLESCSWVVVENQWGEMSILDVETRPYGRSISTVFGISEKSSAYSLEEEPDPLMPRLRMLNYRYMRLCFHPLKDRFALFSGWADPKWLDMHSAREGIDSEEKAVREVVFGSNLIDIEQKSIPRLLVDEVLHPFYVFQVASLILWSLDEYYFYAICIFVMSVGSIATALMETRATMKRLREMSRFECDVRILRNGFWRHVSSSDLVPGDVYEVSDPNLVQFPSDSILLSGDCIVNESMLTGESVPVSKIPATDESIRALDLAASSISPEAARHFLFCGTRIIRARRPHDDQDGEAALALVVRTGFSTTKGSLVRSMLFPKPSGFKFYRDSFRYITVMAIIAMFGFIASLVNFVRLGVAWHLIIVRALDLITIAVPPALPATLTIGTNFALSRLKKKQIFCISPQRVNVGGKLDIMCFDKTGTLTEDGLDVLGVRVVLPLLHRLSDIFPTAESLAAGEEDGERNSNLRTALHVMATCHSLRSVDGELVGDPLDLKMFEFTGWNFQEGSQNLSGNEEDEQGGLVPATARPPTAASNGIGPAAPSIELGVLRNFEFVSYLRRASVIVRRFGQQSGDVYVKGAPECMRDICRPGSFPNDYEEILSHYTHRGYRVIGCATKHMKKLSWIKAQKLKRSDVECDLDFVGFIIFENKLKPSTAGVIDELLRSNIGAVMVTGDNILTAVSVARECNIVDKTAHCFIPHFVAGGAGDSDAHLQWESIDNPLLKLDSKTLLPLPPPVEHDASIPFEISSMRNYCLAVSGEVFRWVVDYAPPQVLDRMLVLGRIFARMSPDEKHELVEKLQSIDYSCGFCGDGANDCGALKAADVGISLSEAEASVAAPFTSRVFDIRCVPTVIREGRAALVTGFCCFKYMSLYSAIQFTTVSFLYASASNLGDFQFLYIDLFLILPIAIFMSWAGAYPVLSRKRPTARLVSRKVLAPLLGQMAICIAVQAGIYAAVREQPWYIPPKVKHDKSNIKNSENTSLFLISCFEYILSALVLSAGRPFRQPLKQNWPFLVTVSAALLLTIYMVLGPIRSVKKLMQLTKMSWDFDLFLITMGAGYLVAAWICEAAIFPRLSRLIGTVKEKMTGKLKKRKRYKVIQETLRLGAT